MGSGVIFYEYESLKEYDDIDVEPTSELGTIKIRRYHFKDEKFTRSVHSGRFDPDRPWSLPSLGSDFIASSEGWMCEGDETKVEETHRSDGAKSVGSKRKELIEEEEDPEEDPDESQPMDTSVESDFLKFLMGDTKPIYLSSRSCPTIESHGSNPSSGYPTSSASLQWGNLSGTWSSSHAPSQ
ncbi:hypothetical protein PIB30_054519 [Stylosanthes scabra]|uniref:Uncharacterized protein n=1 Tax=Stylosanthes scabra TaxID=79078 RepID=A0ABU6VJ01_9FABA|nr:hypothetical protein [Stylosanthes scabra]